MFVVKDPDIFASQIIPQYFDHNKFSSFARQLNFYGFRKMQSKPIRNSDYDAGTAKHVTFFNENFKRGRCDLLKKIQRSTRGGNGTGTDQTKEIQNLRDQVSTLEEKITEMNSQFEDRLRRLELDMLGRMEQMMLTVQQQQQTQIHLQKATSIGSAANQSVVSQLQQQNWEPNTLNYPRGTSTNSGTSVAAASQAPAPGGTTVPSIGFSQQPLQSSVTNSMAAPTLPPHPKQKQLPLPPTGAMPGSMGAVPGRLNSLRGISQLSRGLSRGASIESSASAVLMRNSWEDKFFSMLMLEGNGDQTANAANVAPTPIVGGNNVTSSEAPATVSNRSSNFTPNTGDNDLSSVSSADM